MAPTLHLSQSNEIRGITLAKEVFLIICLFGPHMTESFGWMSAWQLFQLVIILFVVFWLEGLLSYLVESSKPFYSLSISDVIFLFFFLAKR